MGGQEDDQAFERRAKALFDASVASLDAATRGKLAAARHAAVEKARRRAPVAPWLFGTRGSTRGLVTSGAALAAAVAVAVLISRGPTEPAGAVEMVALADWELLLGDDEFEMLEELEFYAWLEEQPELAPPPAGDGVG